MALKKVQLPRSGVRSTFEPTFSCFVLPFFYRARRQRALYEKLDVLLKESIMVELLPEHASDIERESDGASSDCSGGLG